jgi:hypothetical protein
MGIVRSFESGLNLVERCQRDLPALADCLPPDSAGRAAVVDLIEAARRAEFALRWRPADPKQA